MKRNKDSRRRILFVGEGVSLAHVTRPLVLAQTLDPDRYVITFASSADYARLVKAAGFDFHPLHTLSPKLFLKRLAQGIPLYDYQTLMRCVASDLKLIADLKPDLIIGDLRISLGISALRAQLPYANLCNAHWSPSCTLDFPTPEIPLTRLTGPRLAGWVIRHSLPLTFSLHARAFNQVRKKHGLAPVAGRWSTRDVYLRNMDSLPRCAQPRADLR